MPRGGDSSTRPAATCAFSTSTATGDVSPEAWALARWLLMCFASTRLEEPGASPCSPCQQRGGTRPPSEVTLGARGEAGLLHALTPTAQLLRTRQDGSFPAGEVPLQPLQPRCLQGPDGKRGCGTVRGAYRGRERRSRRCFGLKECQEPAPWSEAKGTILARSRVGLRDPRQPGCQRDGDRGQPGMGRKGASAAPRCCGTG